MKCIQGSRFVFWVCIWTIQSIVFGSSCAYNARISTTIPPSTSTPTTISNLEVISSLSSATGDKSSDNIVAIDLKAIRLHEEDVATITNLLLRPRRHVSLSDDSTNAAATGSSTLIQSLSMKECSLSRKHMISLVSSALLGDSHVETFSIHNRWPTPPPPPESTGYCIPSKWDFWFRRFLLNSHVCSQILTSVAKLLDNHLANDVDAASASTINAGTANHLVSPSATRKGFINRHLTTLGVSLNLITHHIIIYHPIEPFKRSTNQPHYLWTTYPF